MSSQARPSRRLQMMIREYDVELPDGRTLHGYDTGEEGRDDRPTVVWHHGTPNIGPPPEPLFPAAERLGIRWMGYDRPSYGGSSPRPGRDVGSAAGDAAAIADAAGVDRFAVMASRTRSSAGWSATAEARPSSAVRAPAPRSF